jgi:hypothetical protein
MLTSSTTSAYFGETFDISLTADEPDNTTIPYTITGVTSQQISNASLTGDFTINGGIASITINLAVQSTNTAATFTINAGAYSSTVSISNLVSFSSNVAETFWGGTIIFTVQTKGVTDGGTVPYTITGVTSAQISNASLTGNAANVLTSGLDGTATFTVVTNSTEPVLNSATMVTSITGASLTNVIRTGSPRLSESYKSSVSSLVFIDTEVTDVHAPGLEATVFALDGINSPLAGSKFNSGLDGFVAAPTFAYSSGEDIKVSATASQTWYI